MTTATEPKPPAAWRIARIGDLFDSWGGHTPSKANSSYWGDGVPWVSSKEVKAPRLKTSTHTVTQKAIDETGLRVCPVGSVLVVVRSGILAHTLPVTVTEVPVTVNQDLKAFFSDEPLLNEWLALFLRMSAHELLASSRRDGTTVQSVQYPLLKNTAIPVPPLDERRLIIETVGTALAKQTSVPPRLAAARRAIERLRQSVLVAACSGRLTADWREQIDVEADNSLPPSWRKATVESLAANIPRAIQSGPFGSNLKHSEFRSEGRLVIGIDNVLEGEFSSGKEHRISPEKFQELQKYEARPLDVLITVMATIGRVCVVPDDIEQAIITKHVYRITADQNVMNPYFLMHALRGDPTVTEQIHWQIRGQTRPGINGQIVKGLVVPVPPLDEQHEIVSRVSTLMNMSRNILARIEAAAKKVDYSSQAVLAKAFRGELISDTVDLRGREGAR